MDGGGLRHTEELTRGTNGWDGEGGASYTRVRQQAWI